MRFVYLGPPDERVMGTRQALTGEWITGEPRLIVDEAAIAWLRSHPHWREVTEDGTHMPPEPRRRGRPRKVI